MVRDLREALGPEVDLCIEIHRRLTPAEAIVFANEIAPYRPMMINLNQTHKDPVLREIFSNRDFRVGLSHAINRDELNQIIYAGVAPPYQAAPRPGTELYDEEMATQYTAYDPALANEYLDHVVPERDQDGFRLRPDGERLSFAVNVLNSRQFQIDALELVRGYWADVGIEMFVRPLERSLSISLRQANDHGQPVGQL